MRHVHALICVGMFLASQIAGATTYHVYATANNVSPNFSTVDAAIDAVNAGPGGDTISIDDSATYITAATKYICAPNTSLVAASGQTPVLNLPATSNLWYIQGYGCKIGSRTGGTIVFDGLGLARRGLNVNPLWANSAGTKGPGFVPWDRASTTTLENLVFKNLGNVGATNSSLYTLWMLTGDGVTTAPLGTTLTIRDVDFQFMSGTPTGATITSPNTYTAIKLNPTSGCVINLENVRSNTLCGYVVNMGTFNSNYTNQWGTLNIKNCRFVYDDPAQIGNTYMACPIATGCPNPTADSRGMIVNIDNSYIRSDSTNSGMVFNAIFPRTSNQDNSLGAISLLNSKNNVLNVTNSAIIGCGAGINIDTAKSSIQLTNSDIYVKNPAVVTRGNFINISPRTEAATGTHVTTATRCNFYGINGSQIQAGRRAAGSTFKMISCNDWSTSNSYANDWQLTTCVQPGKNPGYGAEDGSGDPTAAINAYDLTVYSQAIKSLNIGSDRAFLMGVPVELSTFSVQ